MVQIPYRLKTYFVVPIEDPGSDFSSKIADKSISMKRGLLLKSL